MAGDPITHALAGISALVGRLSPDDRIGLVAFNGKVIRPAPPAPVRDGEYLNGILGQIEPRRGADLSAALEQGIVECIADGRTSQLVLVSTGRPTQGLRRRSQLERIAADGLRQGIRISTIPVGPDADRELLAAIAAAGGGTSAASESADAICRELERLTGAGSAHQREDPGTENHDQGGVDQ